MPKKKHVPITLKKVRQHARSWEFASKIISNSTQLGIIQMEGNASSNLDDHDTTVDGCYIPAGLASFSSGDSDESDISGVGGRTRSVSGLPIFARSAGSRLEHGPRKDLYPQNHQ